MVMLSALSVFKIQNAVCPSDLTCFHGKSECHNRVSTVLRFYDQFFPDLFTASFFNLFYFCNR